MTRAHEEFVAPGAFVFRSRGNAERLHDVVKFKWEVASRDGGEVAGVGPGVRRVRPGDRVTAALFLRWLDGPLDRCTCRSWVASSTDC